MIYLSKEPLQINKNMPIANTQQHKYLLNQWFNSRFTLYLKWRISK